MSVCEENNLKICGNYDDDSCMDFSPVSLCPIGYSCSENICAPKEGTRLTSRTNRLSDPTKGCLVGQTFYPIGYRTNIDYCADNSTFIRQKTKNVSCLEDYECRSNLCDEGVCTEGESPSFAKRITIWWGNLWGGGDESELGPATADESGDSESGGIAESNFNTQGCVAMKNNFDRPNGYYKCKNVGDDERTTYRCVNPTSKTIYSQGGAFGEKYEMFCGGN